MIKVKNIELNDNATKAYSDLLAMDLPVSMSWKISKIVKKVDELLELKNKSYNKIVDKYAEKDENGTIVPVKDNDGKVVPNAFKINDPEGYDRDLTEFNELENELAFEPISVAQISEKNENIKPSIFYSLSYLFVD